MPWITPTLKEMRSLVRDQLRGRLPGVDANVPNSVLRVISDGQGALAHLTLQYIDWLAQQLLPDSAESEWLDRHGRIWLGNADGTRGRKLATLASGIVMVTGSAGVVMSAGTRLRAATGFEYETLKQIVVGSTDTPVEVRALDPGEDGNLLPGTIIAFTPTAPAGLDQTTEVQILDGGTDEETDDELRARVLLRIQQPPMGGDKTDYVEWALAVPGVTRAWCGPLEQGIGTVTIRFMMDDLRINGLPTQNDVDTVAAYIDTKRPVAVKDFFCVAPLPYPLNFYISDLSDDTEDVRASIEQNLKAMFFEKAYPGSTFYRSWADEAISNAIGEAFHELTFVTTFMPAPGYLPVLGSVIYS